jgi:hypothetical protein
MLNYKAEITHTSGKLVRALRLRWPHSVILLSQEGASSYLYMEESLDSGCPQERIMALCAKLLSSTEGNF